jgi:S-adenosylmethionine-diacylglycerol 3-amino-3-carboxypropyl transferase
MKVIHSTHDYLFGKIHQNNLVYNTCWEDPEIDRDLMVMDDRSKVLTITSAGCNVLDYLLDGPQEVHAIDVNPRQNALLELKMAIIATGTHEDLDSMFAQGYASNFSDIYNKARPRLSVYAQAYWDKKIAWFSPENKKTFYYRGGSGLAAWLMKNSFFKMKKNVRDQVYAILDSESLEEQKEIYEHMESSLWDKLSIQMVKSPIVMSMVGVPRPQINLITKDFSGGLYGFVRERIRYVLTETLMKNNYFWRVYILGNYSEECRPNYLREENFEMLKEHVHKVKIHTKKISDHLDTTDTTFTHFHLLDHQDWLAHYRPDLLKAEWEKIIDHSEVGTKIILRSAGLEIDFSWELTRGHLMWFPEITRRLHQRDRVGTYGSLHCACVI